MPKLAGTGRTIPPVVVAIARDLEQLTHAFDRKLSGVVANPAEDYLL
jgi:hypothetical protein